MSVFVDACLNGELLPRLFSAGLLLWIGQLAVRPYPRLKAIGQQLACAALPATLVWMTYQDRALLRDDPVSAISGAAVVAVSVLGLAWLALPAITTVVQTGLIRPARYFRRLTGEGWSRFRVSQTQARERRRVDREERQRRPEREQQTAEHEAIRIREQTEHLQREQLRFDVRLFYDRYRSELHSGFPPDTFETYFTSFLTDGTPLELFAERAGKLKDMIRDRLQLSTQPPHRFETLEELLQHFSERKHRLRALPTDDPDIIDTLVSALDDAQDRALQEFLS